jgi:transcriptional regulator
MYLPKEFEQDDPELLRRAIRESALATLVTVGPEGLLASHVPMLLLPEPAPLGALIGHVSRANSQWSASSTGTDALAIFLGPDAYISPSWYATKRETDRVVPTWNYIAVHASGPISFFDDHERLLDVVSRLTQRHEQDRPSPWAVSDAPPDFIESMLRSILGFSLTIARLEGKWKLSQNQPEANQRGVIAGLQADGRPKQAAVAALMSTGRPHSSAEK